MEPQHGAVGHDGGGHDAGGLRGCEEGVPVLHDAVQCVDPWWTERGMTSGMSHMGGFRRFVCEGANEVVFIKRFYIFEDIALVVSLSESNEITLLGMCIFNLNN